MQRGRRDSVAFTVVVGILVLVGGIAMALTGLVTWAVVNLPVAVLALFFAGHLSDGLGRKRMLISGFTQDEVVALRV